MDTLPPVLSLSEQATIVDFFFREQSDLLPVVGEQHFRARWSEFTFPPVYDHLHSAIVMFGARTAMSTNALTSIPITFELYHDLRVRVLSCIPLEQMNCTLEPSQATCLLAMAGLIDGDLSSSWTYCGLAIRAAFGVQLDLAQADIDHVLESERRNLWWSCFFLVLTNLHFLSYV
jgi:hypothetical protein